MGIERRSGYWLWVGGPVPPGAGAVTIGPLIVMRPHRAGNERLLRHELVHVAQWRRHGVVGFLWRYLVPYVRWRLRGYPHWGAYRRIPFEIEAEWTARTMGALDPAHGGPPDATRSRRRR